MSAPAAITATLLVTILGPATLASSCHCLARSAQGILWALTVVQNEAHVPVLRPYANHWRYLMLLTGYESF